MLLQYFQRHNHGTVSPLYHSTSCQYEWQHLHLSPWQSCTKYIALRMPAIRQAVRVEHQSLMHGCVKWMFPGGHFSLKSSPFHPCKDMEFRRACDGWIWTTRIKDHVITISTLTELQKASLILWLMILKNFKMLSLNSKLGLQNWYVYDLYAEVTQHWTWNIIGYDFPPPFPLDHH